MKVNATSYIDVHTCLKKDDMKRLQGRQLIYWETIAKPKAQNNND